MRPCISKHATVHAPDAMRNVTVDVHVTGLYRFKMRMRLGLWLVRLGVRIAGFEHLRVSLVTPDDEEGYCDA